jgi:glycosyltransferase involved in cell wall biosynthesis
LRILLIVNEFPPDIIAGTSMSTFYLSRHLARIGHEVHVAVTVRGNRSPRIESLGQVTVYRLNPIPVKGTRSLQRLAALYRLARSIHPDIIQGQALSCGALAALIGNALRIPSITYIQGLDLYHATPLQKSIELKTALQAARCVLAVTEDLRGRAAALSGRRDIIVMPHGLEPADDIEPEVDRLKLEVSDLLQHRVLLYAGQLHERKGVLELLEAMKRVHARVPDVLLAVLGQGHLEKRLRQEVRRENLEGVVRFLGPRPHRTVMAFMRLAEVFVLPSREESFGIVLIEAMSQGLPIVTTRVHDLPRLIRQGVNGLLVAPGDTGGMAESIVRLFEHREEAAAMGRRNREDARRYDWRLLAARYDRLYERLQTHPHRGLA